MRSIACLLAALPLVACGSDPASSTAGTGGSTSASSTTGAGGAGGTGGAGPTGPLSAQVTHYDYKVDLVQKRAHSALTLDVAAPGGDCFTVNCLPATVTDPTWNGAPATTFSLADGAFTACGGSVTTGQPLLVETEVELIEKTFFGLDVGLSHKKNLAGGTFRYLLSWVGGCDRFGPCDDDPSRLASFHVEVTHAPGEVALCAGTLTAGDTVSQCDLSGTLAPTYSAFFAATDPLWKKQAHSAAAGVSLVFYEVPGGKLGETLDPPSVSAFLDWITALLGPLPYGKELRIAGAPTAWLGFEHPANIILKQDLPKLSMAYQSPTFHVFMHEVVHQWAGDRTTLASTPDFVWKEATAEYLSYVFEDEHRPPAEAAASLAYWDAISVQSTFHPRPTDEPAPAVQTFYGDVYGPGPMTLYVQLEPFLGRAKVLAGIAKFLSMPGARSVDDLRVAFEDVSGLNLKPYFEAWVFGKGKPEWPTLALATEQIDGEVSITVTQENPSGKRYGLAVEVEVSGATMSATAVVDFGLDPQSNVATAKVTLAEPVTSVALDPRHKLISKSPMIPGAPLAPPPRLPVWPL